jgi:hypothetical protein
MKYSKGKWVAQEDYGHFWVKCVRGGKTFQVADVTDIDVGADTDNVRTDPEETRGNAAILAASARLYEACLSATTDPIDKALPKIKAALALCRPEAVAVGKE